MTKLKAVLLDLDDTLLGNTMDGFVPAYFRALTEYMADVVPPDRLRQELLRGTHAMDANAGDGPTNEEAFSAVFYPGLGRARDELEPALKRFYREEFPRLHHLTHRLPESRALVTWAFERGLQVAIATNPLFPRQAIDHRLAWAGVPPSEFDFDLVTTYENMHATKSNPAYYREILRLLGRLPEECVMVGDDWIRDMKPAFEVGIPIFWISPSNASRPEDFVRLAGRGTLADFWAWLRQTHF